MRSFRARQLRNKIFIKNISVLTVRIKQRFPAGILFQNNLRSVKQSNEVNSYVTIFALSLLHDDKQ